MKGERTTGGFKSASVAGWTFNEFQHSSKPSTLAVILPLYNMKLLDKQIFEKAIKLQNVNKHKNALKLLHELENKYSDYTPLYGLLGKSYYLTNDFQKSAKYFKKCLTVNPNSELASLGLFHSLESIGKLKSAFLEMERFLCENKPKLYKVTIAEMNENIEKYIKTYQQNIIKKHT